MKFSKSQLVVLAAIAGIKTKLTTTPNRKDQAIKSLKKQGWIFKEIDSPFLKFTDKAFLKMALLKTKINGAA